MHASSHRKMPFASRAAYKTAKSSKLLLTLADPWQELNWTFWTIVAAILIRRPARCCSLAGRQVNTMSTATKTLSHGEGAARNEPRFIFHPSFEDPGARRFMAEFRRTTTTRRSDSCPMT